MSLEKYGFLPKDDARRVQLASSKEAATAEFATQLETLATEVLVDAPHSPLYFYALNEQGQMFSCDNKGELLSEEPIKMNPGERGGYVALGNQRTAEALRANRGSLVLHFSPGGPVTFESDVALEADEHFAGREDDFTKVRDYQDGQLYIQTFDGQKTTAVALKAGNEAIIQRILEAQGLPQHIGTNEVDRIKYYLSNPLVLDTTPEAFSQWLGAQHSDGVLYSDKVGNGYTMHDIGQSLDATFNGTADRPGQIFAQHAIDYARRYGPVEEWTPDVIQAAYLSMAVSFAEQKGVDMVEFQGGCGGMENAVIEMMHDMGFGTTSGAVSGGLLPYMDMYGTGYRQAQTLTEADLLNTKRAEPGYKGPWRKGVCRPEGKGGCGQEKHKVGLCNIYSDCQVLYDKGKMPFAQAA